MTEPRSAQSGGGGGADQKRQDWAEGLVARLDGPMSALGVVFLFVVLGQTLARSPVLVTVLAVSAWGLWLIFAGEFLLRLYVAPRRGRFLRKHWWQVVFLALPFLRFLRLVRLVRFVRAGGVVSSADTVGEFTPDTRVSGRAVRASGLHERKPGPGRRNGSRRHAEFDGEPGP
ncbi:hypothetical protein [Nocardia sp. CC201C]|uniref:hypothetical protein n=1 Tax=Nocardia sp. CC201C TaxID=3044575 RepID=UPI0024A7BA0E|nr:hypothetical protein [Nocardia sp. CC201C]